MNVTAVEFVPPKLTLAPLLKLLPVIVTTLPPAVGTEEGETLEIATGLVEPDPELEALVELNTTSTQ
jgi:hypothetical protein